MLKHKEIHLKSREKGSPTGVLTSETLPISRVDSETREQMWRLYVAYYSDAMRETFIDDFSAKDHVIILRDSGNGSLQGFSTLQCFGTKVQGKPLYVIYSGDTLVSKEYWGQNALQKAFFKYIVKCKISHPFRKVYWFLISKGYKTYLLLSRNYPVYWPRHDKPTPSWEKNIIDTLGADKFGDEYYPEKGIIHHEDCPGKLRASVAPIGEDLRKNHPDIDYFVKRNPFHAEGDELCCLGLVCPSMWMFYVGRLCKKLLPGGVFSAARRLSGRLQTEQSYRQ